MGYSSLVAQLRELGRRGNGHKEFLFWGRKELDWTPHDSPPPWEGLQPPGLHPFWLAGLLRAFLPSFPSSLLCLRLLPASRCSRPRVCAQAGTGDQQGLHSDAEAGTAAWSRGLIAHLVLSWLARQPVGGALHTTPRAAGLQGLPGIPEG